LTAEGDRRIAPKQVSLLQFEILRAGQQLKTHLREDNPKLDEELAECRTLVESLRELLSPIHSELLRERARLEQMREKSLLASAWVERSRQIL
jgi:hypothetical protein